MKRLFILTIGILSILSLSFSVSAQYYDFGGMYSSSNNNPLSGTMSCPPGGYTNVSLDIGGISYCYRSASKQDYLAGSFATSSGGCPNGYSNFLGNLYNGYGKCYVAGSGQITTNGLFGGIYSVSEYSNVPSGSAGGCIKFDPYPCGGGGICYAEVLCGTRNPLTNDFSCPSGFAQSTIMSADSSQRVVSCYKNPFPNQPLSCTANPGIVNVSQIVSLEAFGGYGNYAWLMPGGIPSNAIGAVASVNYTTNGTKTITLTSTLNTTFTFYPSVAVQYLTIPANVNRINVTVCGGGGGGGFASSSTSGAWGGAGGGKAFSRLNVSAGQIFNMSVANGGGSGNPGSPGGESRFYNSTSLNIRATGGGAGTTTGGGAGGVGIGGQINIPAGASGNIYEDNMGGAGGVGACGINNGGRGGNAGGNSGTAGSNGRIIIDLEYTFPSVLTTTCSVIVINETQGIEISSPTPNITSARWENSANVLINQAMLGDNVKLSAYTVNMTGKNVNFTIYNKSNGFIIYRGSATASAFEKAELSGTLSSFVSGKAGIGAFIYFNATYYNSTTGAIIDQKKSNDLEIVSVPVSNLNMCSSDRRTAYDSLGIGHNTSIADSENWCFGFKDGDKDSWPDSLRNYTLPLNDCCSAGQICTNTSGGSPYFKCAQCTKTYLGIDDKYHAITRCNDYSNLNTDNVAKAESCKSDCANARNNENNLLLQNNPYYVRNSAFCYWDSGSNKCNVNYNRTSTSNPSSSYSCQDETTGETGSCDEGNEFKTITYRSKRTQITFNANGGFVITEVSENPSNPECPDGEISVPCRQSVIALPFFNALNIIISALIIVAVYFIIFKTEQIKKIFK